ncbi:MAG: hypothetical protein STHCBS139747_005114 [Sporothrix thermara]
MENGDPSLPAYAAIEEDGLVAWIDSMAARAEELQLPLTHPRFNLGIFWIKEDDVTIAREWSRYYYQPEAAVSSHQQPPRPRPPPNPAVVEAERAADILMTQKIIIERFFRLVRMGQVGLVARCIQKGLVSPDVTDGRGYDDMYGRQFVPEEEEEEEKKKKKEMKEEMKEMKKKRENQNKQENSKDGHESKRWWKRRSETRLEPCPPRKKNVPPLTSTWRGDTDNGATPLLVAVDAGDANMVRTLVSLGANINHMARPPDLRRFDDVDRSQRHKFRWGLDNELDRRVRRTPLMLAAAQGRIALVRLLWQELHADDALIAPDGYTALRLAAHARHRDIVALLPARHGGAWLRFSTRHGRAFQRIRRAGADTAWFVTAVSELIFWKAPKLLLYHAPKELIVQPLGRACRVLWRRRREILPAIGRWLAKLPGYAKAFALDLGRLVVDIVKAVSQLVARVPQGLRYAWEGVVTSFRVIGQALAHVVGRTVSALHTAAIAVLTFFRSITLADVVGGLKAVVQAVFVDFPQAVWRAIESLGESTYEAAEAVFGGVAFLVYLVGLLIFYIIIYVPCQVWEMLAAVGSIFVTAFHEVVVCFNPKSVF